jgi:DNA-binding GntR family transcriptional regulator
VPHLFTTHIQPIVIKDRVVELIRNAIFSGKLRPGDRIVELRLAKELGLGTTSVREALFELEAQGFISRIPNRGTFVTELSPEDTQQIYRIRLDLEGLAVELVTESRDEDAIAALYALVDAMEAAARVSFTAFVEKDLEFHRALWTFSRNRHLIRLLENVVVPLFAFYVMRTEREPENLLRDVQPHRNIVDAMRTRTPAEARKIAADTLQLFSKLALQDLRDSERKAR